MSGGMKELKRPSESLGYNKAAVPGGAALKSTGNINK